MTSSFDFDRLVFFGDSLTDTGGIFELSRGNLVIPLPPESLGYAQRFSNGEVYADIAPRLLGIDEVDNFALGAADSLGVKTLGELLAANDVLSLQSPDADLSLLDFDINFNSQIDRFLEDTGDTQDTAASILIGLNDFNRLGAAGSATTVEEAIAFASTVATNTLAGASKLVEAGVETIILNTLPVGRFFPASFLIPPFPESVLEAHNQTLLAGREQLMAAGAVVQVVDFAAIAEEIATDLSAFGFLAPLPTVKFFGIGGNPTVTETPDGPVLSFFENPFSFPNLDQQVFFDLVHPTTAAHGVFAAFYAESLTSDVQILDGKDDSVKGSRADDLVIAGAGNDWVSLRGGNDVALGGLGNDIVIGGAGNDIISLGSGDDVSSGGRGDDVIAGGRGNDLLLGGSGNDVLIDGLGWDTAFGGGGDDVFIFSQASLIGGFDGIDQNVFFGGSGRDTLVVAVREATRDIIEQADNLATALTRYLGISTRGIETIEFVESAAELNTLQVDARIAEADLWGLI